MGTVSMNLTIVSTALTGTESWYSVFVGLFRREVVAATLTNEHGHIAGEKGF